jgi:hypothetical protein
MGISSPDHGNKKKLILLISAAAVLCAGGAAAYFLFNKKTPEFLTAMQIPAGDGIKVTLKTGGKSDELLLLDDASSRKIFRRAPLLRPYNLQTSFVSNGQEKENITVAVNRDTEEVLFRASGFEEYPKFSMTVDNNILFSDTAFDWTGQFSTSLIYYTKPGGFVLCFSAAKADNKSEGIEWCHGFAEAKQG